MAAREIVLALRLSEGTTREQFRALKGALIDVRDEITQNNKALRENAKEQRALDVALKEGAITAEQAAVRSQALTTAREQLKTQSAQLASQEASLAAIYREVKNDVGGLTDAGLRFRDKMAQATIEALKQEGVLGKLGARMDFLRSEQERLNQEQKAGKITQDQYARSSEKLAQEEKDLAAQITSLNGKVDTLTNEFKQGRVTQEEFRKGIAQINTAVDGTGNAIKQGVADLKGYALGFVGIVAVAQAAISAIKAIGKTVAEFDQGLANIRALGEEFAGSIDKIGQAAIALGPKLGIAPVEALKGFEALAKAGLTTEQILSGGLESALTLAAAGTIEVGQAAEITAASLTQFNLQGEQAGLVADLLAKGANIAQGDVADFGAALNQTGLVANAYGLSIEETVGALTAFAQAGLIGSDAGTSFKAALLRLQAPTEKAKQILDQYGIVLTDTNGNFKDLASVAGELQTKLSGLTQEQRSAALAQIFGQDAIRVANILYKEGAQGIAEYTRQVNDTGFANSVAQTKLESISGSVDKLSASWDAVVSSFVNGDGPIQSAIQTLIDGLGDILKGFAGLRKDPVFAEIEQRVDDFTKRVNKNLTALGDVQLFGKSDAVTTRFDRDTKLVEQAARAALASEEELNRRRLFFQQKITEAADAQDTRAKAIAIARLQLFDELIAKAKQQADAETRAADTIGDETAATQGSIDANEREGASIESLKAKLKEEKSIRDGLTDPAEIDAANVRINGIKEEIAALEGSTKKTKEQTDVEKEKITVTQALTKAEEDRTRAQEIAAKAKTIRAADPTITEPQAQAQAAAIIDSTARIQLFQGDADTIKRIEAQLQEDLAAIDAKFAEEKVKNQDKANADLRTRNAALAQNELDALIERQNAELILAAKNGEDVNALAKSQAEERIALTQQIEDAAIAAKLESFDAEYALAEQNGTDIIALTATQQEELAALKASFRENDVAKQLELNEQLKDADQALLEAKVDAAGAIGNALVTVAQQGSAAAKIGLAIQKAAAVAQVIVQTQYAIAAATAAAASIPAILPPGIPNPAFPIAQAISVAQIAKLKIGAGINIATIVAQAIAGFDEGGEVGSGNGTIKRSWGKPIRRKNGDNVLITAREGEKILNEDQQEELERLAGRDVWHRIGLPGAKYFGKTRDSFLEAMGYAGGGTVYRGTALVNATAPTLTAIESVAEQRSFELNVVADIEEIVSVMDRRMAILETSRSR